MSEVSAGIALTLAYFCLKTQAVGSILCVINCCTCNDLIVMLWIMPRAWQTNRWRWPPCVATAISYWVLFLRDVWCWSCKTSFYFLLSIFHSFLGPRLFTNPANARSFRLLLIHAVNNNNIDCQRHTVSIIHSFICPSIELHFLLYSFFCLPVLQDRRRQQHWEFRICRWLG